MDWKQQALIAKSLRRVIAESSPFDCRLTAVLTVGKKRTSHTTTYDNKIIIFEAQIMLTTLVANIEPTKHQSRKCGRSPQDACSARGSIKSSELTKQSWARRSALSYPHQKIPHPSGLKTAVRSLHGSRLIVAGVSPQRMSHPKRLFCPLRCPTYNRLFVNSAAY